MKINQITEQRIKDAANIVDVVGDFITLKKAGVNYHALCPFHDDRHIGSFVVHPAGNCYRCFSCDAKGGPIDFLMNYEKMTYPDALRYLAAKYGIHIDDEDAERWKDVKPAKPRENVEQDLPERTWPTEWIGYYKNLENDNFVRWMKSLPWEDFKQKRLEQVLQDYHVGHTHFRTLDRHTGEYMESEWTMWWQLDEHNILHNCHLMKYREDGHRDKDDPYNQTWLHARMKYAKGANHFDDEQESASYCLFGQHLLNEWPNACVNIVESEKTAIFMATAHGNHYKQIWMACAGMQNLSKKRLQPLIDTRRKILLFPDRDGIARWKAKAAEIGYDGMRVNTTPVLKWWRPEDGEKADIADIVERMIRQKEWRL